LIKNSQLISGKGISKRLGFSAATLQVSSTPEKLILVKSTDRRYTLGSLKVGADFVVLQFTKVNAVKSAVTHTIIFNGIFFIILSFEREY